MPGNSSGCASQHLGNGASGSLKGGRGVLRTLARNHWGWTCSAAPLPNCRPPISTGKVATHWWDCQKCCWFAAAVEARVFRSSQRALPTDSHITEGPALARPLRRSSHPARAPSPKRWKQSLPWGSQGMSGPLWVSLFSGPLQVSSTDFTCGGMRLSVTESGGGSQQPGAPATDSELITARNGLEKRLTP